METERSTASIGLLTPDFIGIGPPRSGSRWLARCLEEHPEVSVVDEEVYYFTRRRVVASFWWRGPEWYEDRLCKARRPGTKVVGEITPVYLLDDDTPELIHDFAPRTRLITCLRDQCDRAESWYRLFLRHNPAIRPKAYPPRKFLTYQNDVFGREGFYLEHLERFWRFFPPEQLLVLLYDDLEAEPGAFLRRVFDFLGVDDRFVPPSAGLRINQLTPEVRAPRKGLLPRLRADVVEADSQEAARYFRFPADLRDEMHRLYEEHNRRLGRLLGQDLTHWNTGRRRPG